MMRRVHFNVLEPMRGEPSTEIEVLTGMGGGDCGYGFQVGQSYLVYANPWQGQLTTSICSRTQILSKAEEDVNYIHSRANAPPGANLFGSITRLSKSAEDARLEEPLAGIKVQVTFEDGTKVTAESGADGKFSVAGLRPGKYTIKPQFPDSLTENGDRGERSVELADRGCAREDFYAVVNGRISGRAVNADGTPATNVPLLLDSADGWKTNPLMSCLHTETDADGHFEFRGLSSDEYVLGVTMLNPPTERNPYPKTFYPGVEGFDAAARLRVGEAEEIRNLDFRLPQKLIAARITIVVVGSDGKPAVGARVTVNDKEFNGPPWALQTDSEARAEVPVFEGRTYSLWAGMAGSGHQMDCQGQTDLTVKHSLGPIRLQVDCGGKRK